VVYVKLFSYWKQIDDGWEPFTFVETSYLHTAMHKFESSQKGESRAQSAGSLKAFNRPRASNCKIVVFKLALRFCVESVYLFDSLI